MCLIKTTDPFSPLFMTDGSVSTSPTPTEKQVPLWTMSPGNTWTNKCSVWFPSCLCSKICAAVFTLQVQHQQLSTGVLVGPVAEGQHRFLQEVGGNDLLSVVVVELAELAGDALLYGEPLPGWVAVQQKHFEEPGHTGYRHEFYKETCFWPGFWFIYHKHITLYCQRSQIKPLSFTMFTDKQLVFPPVS